MAEHLIADGAYVLRNDISPALDEGIGLCGHGQGNAGTRGCAIGNQVLQGAEPVILRGTGRIDYIHDIPLDLFVHVNVADDAPGTDDILRFHNRGGLREGSLVVHADNLPFLILLRVGDDNLQHESVDLGFRKRVSPLLLYRVLCRHDEEGLRELEGLVADSHLTLLHGLQKGRLDFCRASVDFIGKDEIREDGALVDLEILILLGIDKRTDYIGRKEVRGKLDTVELRIYRLGQSIDCQGFGKSGDTFEEDMAVREKAYQEVVHEVLLTDDNLPHLQGKEVYKRTFVLDTLVEFLNVYTFHFIVYFCIVIRFVMRYSITLSYDGGAFCGWQIQPGSPSVQECLEKALSTLIGEKVSVTGAGRTDTKVNAIGYVAHFDVSAETPLDTALLTCKLNAILPPSIAVSEVTPATPEFHARFDAVRREYTYFIHRVKDPFMESYSYRCGYPGLDFERMNRAAEYLLGDHDFACFEKTGGNSKTSLCTVYEAFWAPYTPSHLWVIHGPTAPSPSYWYFRISANRFLRNMVRAIVGTLIEVGRGKHEPEWVLSLLDGGGSRSDAGESVPGHALFLTSVQYLDGGDLDFHENGEVVGSDGDVPGGEDGRNGGLED